MDASETLPLPGRILCLAADEARLRAQFAGQRLTRAEAGALRDDVSTDAITPVAEVQRVHAAVVSAFADAEVKEAMAKQGSVISVQPAGKAMPFFRSELAKYAQIVKKAGIEPQ